QGVRHLAAQMAPPGLNILEVGGLLEGDDYVLGCDAAGIAAALETAWTPAGVMNLADLGSSILSAETALELVPPHMAATCCISNAPLVEGAIIAAIEDGLGHALADVNRAAEAAAHVTKVNRAGGP